MNKKRLIGFLVIIIVVAMGIVIMKFMHKRAESIENTENMEDVENIQDTEIADEISNNKEFYKQLENLYNLDEIWFILSEGEIAFYLIELPKDYIGGFYYWENTDECDYGGAKIIDEHWTLEILPAI